MSLNYEDIKGDLNTVETLSDEALISDIESENL